ncbi:bifunctional 2-C-methyl-D-erythritol 4-phosphate cytidylyltransferase/2-C-methyl-D-erythritol 2,4-cyclodiphosphate synthase [Parvularcula sp. ZS-1/3]|uniref:Bifunctional enzyme IspD/IspF n=1 Tax=Parvularcula mediterranea TaxID=2732508 RepID=A0A7Y3RIP3_9PROT|nr:bifunctional 2-C-methyl-D-erythritol 4-phosphate cytidylyltransferase/2-C-methyl-D-erythritol 2,4-cyclodiphosphate synthase [Parvularcula mediterranea]NNU14815.1 bifunctional 2-C-methyl-D-erythritol 4-phosphate cytidylyltransferase/2-C-methyl-D-erythritol 2,4-cyclodiphosphate synthase [Parvularcula mediterranea]
MKSVALIVAAGKGLRAGGEIPKQYQELGGEPVLRRTLRAFAQHPAVSAVLCVIGEGHEELFAAAAEGLEGVLPPVRGGAERQSSVLRGLKALEGEGADIVLIHDGARPLVSARVIDDVISAASEKGGAIAALPLADTLKREKDGGTIEETVPRAGLWRAQTPQGFRYSDIHDVHRQYAEREDMTDDASLFEAAGRDVALVEDDPSNIKITRPKDFVLAARLLESAMETRTGSGFDVHAFEEGDHVTLCGVRIPHTHKLKGHSDADVGMHALTDAIYGALADGDIGQHFPPSDEQWRGAKSHVFLNHAAELVKKRGGKIIHCDITIMCEAPKVGPHREAMRAALAEIMGIDLSRVAVKATTTEKLGFTGRGEGIAAQAVASVALPA